MRTDNRSLYETIADRDAQLDALQAKLADANCSQRHLSLSRSSRPR